MRLEQIVEPGRPGAFFEGHRQSSAQSRKEFIERALGVVLSLCSKSTSPASPNMQYQLDRSSRSRPMVSFCAEKFLLCFAVAVLTFIAGLLYLLCLKHVDNLGAYSIPSGDRPSHSI